MPSRRNSHSFEQIKSIDLKTPDSIQQLPSKIVQNYFFIPQSQELDELTTITNVNQNFNKKQILNIQLKNFNSKHMIQELPYVSSNNFFDNINIKQLEKVETTTFQSVESATEVRQAEVEYVTENINLKSTEKISTEPKVNLSQNVQQFPTQLININRGAILQDDKPIFVFHQELSTSKKNDSEKNIKMRTNRTFENFQTLVPTYTYQVLVPLLPSIPVTEIPIPTQLPVTPEPPILIPNKNNKVTIVLKPQSKAIAGRRGTAIASPYSKAILDRNTDVEVIYHPEAVAIAGPGGIAHAQSELDIGYYIRKRLRS